MIGRLHLLCDSVQKGLSLGVWLKRVPVGEMELVGEEAEIGMENGKMIRVE